MKERKEERQETREGRRGARGAVWMWLGALDEQGTLGLHVWETQVFLVLGGAVSAASSSKSRGTQQDAGLREFYHAALART